MITPEAIEDFKTIRRDSITQYGKQRTKTSVNREMEILSKIFNLAIDYERAQKNPCRKVQRFVLQNNRVRYFSFEEEERLMAVLTGTLAHLRPFVVVGLGTGLRPPSEIFSLRKQDVDFERNVLRAGTKTNEQREVPMSASVRAALLELYNKAKGNYLFTNRYTGKQLIKVKNGFAKACQLAQIAGASAYTMRHTFGTRLGDAGFSLHEIAALMGHRNLKTTAQYAHATDARKRAAVESTAGRKEQAPHKTPTIPEEGLRLVAGGSGK